MNVLAQIPNLNQSASPGTPSLDELMSGLRPIKPAVELPTEPEAFPYALVSWGIVGVILLLALAWWIWKKRHHETSLTAEQSALDSLEKITNQDLDNSDFVLKVSHVLKTYLEDKELFAAVRQTTEEFLDSLKNSESLSEYRESLKAFFEQCDLVKFAGGGLVDKQREELVDNVRTLVKDIAQDKSTENLTLTE